MRLMQKYSRGCIAIRVILLNWQRERCWRGSMAEIKKYTIETSLTLDYRRERWGLERLVLDGVSNHLPNDSLGTRVSVKLKQAGVYYELHEADCTKPVDEIVFEDDGAGYDAKLLSVLFSTKRADELSVGQFGEGLKMVAATALRENVDLEYHSRNWIAKPSAKHETIDGHELDRLCFEIIENGYNIQGSRTVIHNPSQIVINEIFNIPTKILALNRTYSELFNEKDRPKTFIKREYEKNPLGFGARERVLQEKLKQRYHDRIIDLHPAEELGEKIIGELKSPARKKRHLFVKGVRVIEIPALFDYDLGLEHITPDRSSVNEDKIQERINNLVVDCTNQEVITRILQRAQECTYGMDYELQAFLTKEEREGIGRSEINFKGDINFPTMKEGYINKMYEIKRLENILHPWRVAFTNLYGEKAVLRDENSSTINTDVERMGYTVISLHSGVARFLAGLGVTNAREIAGPTTTKNEFCWISLEQLTTQEQTMYHRIPEINTQLGIDTLPEVRIYAGLFDAKGSEIESSLGVQITEPDGTRYIGIKQSELQTIEKFYATYIHELGHFVTRRADYDPLFTQFFIDKLSKIIDEDND